jgi:hypothetical protein
MNIDSDYLLIWFAILIFTLFFCHILLLYIEKQKDLIIEFFKNREESCRRSSNIIIIVRS